MVELLNTDIKYNKGCKYSNNSTKFKCTSASDTFIAPRGIDLLVNDKMEGVRIIVISTVYEHSYRCILRHACLCTESYIKKQF